MMGEWLWRCGSCRSEAWTEFMRGDICPTHEVIRCICGRERRPVGISRKATICTESCEQTTEGNKTTEEVTR